MVKKIVLMLIVMIITSASIVWSNGRKYEIEYVNQQKESRLKQKENKVLGKPYSIAIIPKLEGISYFDAAEKGAMEAAWDLDVQVIFKGPKDSKPESQEQIVKQMIEQKVDAIAISANDPVKLLPVLQEAQRNRIKVITWDSDTDPAGRAYFVNPVNSETLGLRLMDTLAWSLGEKGDFAIISSSRTAANTNNWIKWIEVQREKYYPNMKLIDIVPSDDNFETAYHAAMKLIRDHPHLRGIIGTSAVASPAAAKAIVQSRKEGTVHVFGLSTPNDMRPYLLNGVSPMVTLWSPMKLGYLTVSIAKNLLDGQTPYDGQSIPEVGKINVKNDVITMGEAIDFTKENVNQYDF